MNLALLLAAALATAVGAAALHAARGLRRQLTALRAELAATAPVPATGTAAVPQVPLAEIRAVVAEALVEEREQELAEARAFWAAQEARDGADAPSLTGEPNGFGDEIPLFLPRPTDLVSLESVLEPETTAEPASAEEAASAGHPDISEVDLDEEAADLTAARRRHPSHPDFTPVSTITEHERTVTLLEELAEARIPLTDIRPGRLGTLDVYIFADGTTVCLTPGHQEMAERLAEALHKGEAPVLLGGSGVSGAYALTFGFGEENLYVLADRVIASL